MLAAMGLAACFYNNAVRNGSLSHSAFELSQQQCRDMYTLRKNARPVCEPARGSIDSCLSGTVQIVNEPQSSRALDHNKDLDNTPLMCQRLLMRLMRYNDNAEYSPGKTLVVSDVLSRSPINGPSVSSTEEDVSLHVHLIESNIPVSPGKRSQLQISTRYDATLQSAIVYTPSGWPIYEQEVPDDMKELFNVGSQLSVSDADVCGQNRRSNLIEIGDVGTYPSRSSRHYEVPPANQNFGLVARDNQIRQAHSDCM